MGVKGDHMYLNALVEETSVTTSSSKLYRMDLHTMDLNLMIDFVERRDVAKPNFGVGFIHADYIYMAQYHWITGSEEGYIVRVSLANNAVIRHPSNILTNGGGNWYNSAFTNGVYGFLPGEYYGGGTPLAKVYRFKLDFQGGISHIDFNTLNANFRFAHDGLCSGQVCYVFDRSTRRARLVQSNPASLSPEPPNPQTPKPRLAWFDPDAFNQQTVGFLDLNLPGQFQHHSNWISKPTHFSNKSMRKSLFSVFCQRFVGSVIRRIISFVSV